jgi:hypothetical protein
MIDWNIGKRLLGAQNLIEDMNGADTGGETAIDKERGIL